MKLTAKGNTAEIYQYDDDLICKLFYPGYPKINVEHEFENAAAVFQLGIRTPKAYQIVDIDGRAGILYKRIFGEELSSRIYGANERERVRWIDRFADFHKELLRYAIDGVMDYKEFLKLFAAGSLEISAGIDGLGEGNCLLHGDFHPGNVMVDMEGCLNLIDMMNVCKGPALYDIARTYFLLGNDEKLRSRYLELMGYELETITPYLSVIAMIREREVRR